MEGDLDKLTDLVFKGNSNNLKPIQIIGDFETTVDLFEALLMIFTKGMRILFAVDGTVPLSDLTPEQFSEFITRFQSLSITPIVAKYHIHQLLQLQGVTIDEQITQEWKATKDNYPYSIPLDTLTDYKTTTSEKLEDYYFQFQSENHYYIINFKLLN